MKLSDWQKAEEALKKGGVAFVPTDTLYGLVASALDKKAVERIYKIRGRDKGKPCIVLISSFADLKKFGVSISIEQKKFLESIWPGKVSVILPCTARKFQLEELFAISIFIRT
jgi:L-threonylcarbamoyladenylate synthase